MPETPEPPPAAPRTRNQVLAIGAILLAAAVPIALAFGVDVCTPLRAVGVELDACALPGAAPISPGSTPSMGDGGSP
jgi:hypothetical protein